VVDVLNEVPIDDAPSVEISERARGLLKDALVWDAHGGFTSKPDQTLDELRIWERNHVDFLSVNVGFDIHPWEFAIRTVAEYRRWFAMRPERFVLVETSDDIVRAAAASTGVAGPAARARVHCGDQLEPRREFGAACRARHRDDPGFERFAQHFQRAAVPFG